MGTWVALTFNADYNLQPDLYRSNRRAVTWRRHAPPKGHWARSRLRCHDPNDPMPARERSQCKTVDDPRPSVTFDNHVERRRPSTTRRRGRGREERPGKTGRAALSNGPADDRDGPVGQRPFYVVPESLGEVTCVR